MVYYSFRATMDLANIFDGLLNWRKHSIEYDHAVSYHNDIKEICESLDQPGFHFDTKYRIHKQFGKKIFPYRRNKNTTWYIIYDYDKTYNIVYIQHIMPNHITTMVGK